MNYSKTALDIRKKILKMTFLSQDSHIGSCLSCVDLLTVLYFKTLDLSPSKLRARNRDIFIMSKGHAAAAHYAALAKRGFFSSRLLNSYCIDGGKLSGHSSFNVPGVEVSTGSLGHGLAVGAGMALAAKHAKRKSQIVVMLSDGECQEGSVWETALFASQHRLDNLVAIIDFNKWQGYGKTSEVMDIEPLSQKWQSFKWQAQEIDGHNFSQIETALQKTPLQEGKPSVIIAHTIKGKGISFMEDTLQWHYKSVNRKQYKQALTELTSSNA